MRIINQDRDLSLNFEDLEIFVYQNAVRANIGDRSAVLGVYETEDRSKEVFEEIHKCYSNMLILFNNVDCDDNTSNRLQEWNFNAILCATDSKSKVEYINNQVYYMPKE